MTKGIPIEPRSETLVIMSSVLDLLKDGKGCTTSEMKNHLWDIGQKTSSLKTVKIICNRMKLMERCNRTETQKEYPYKITLWGQDFLINYKKNPFFAYKDARHKYLQEQDRQHELMTS